MRIVIGQIMAKEQTNAAILAGAGGVELGESRTNHQGRHAILLVRGSEDITEFSKLVKTMGIKIIEVINQSGDIDAKGYFGKGRLRGMLLMNYRHELKVILGRKSILF